MSIRYLAQELYRLEQKVTELKKKVEAAGPRDLPDLEIQLRKAEAQRNEWWAMLEAKKETPAHKRTFT